MNARMKAKHFKRLYELSKIHPIYIRTNETTLKHYRVRKLISDEMVQNVDKELLDKLVVGDILDELAPAIKANMVTVDESMYGRYCAECEIWMRN